LSTHSPQILSHLDRNSIWLLVRNKAGVIARRPQDSYGQEASRILEDLMDVSARPMEVEREFVDLFLAIETGEIEKAKHLLGQMQARIGNDPDLVKANVLIKRKEVLGR